MRLVPGLRREDNRIQQWIGYEYYYETVNKRIYEHKRKLIEGFTKEHYIHGLVYYEHHKEVEEAILREKQMKKWNRKWKIRLIEEKNPEWKDLYNEIV